MPKDGVPKSSVSGLLNVEVVPDEAIEGHDGACHGVAAAPSLNEVAGEVEACICSLSLSFNRNSMIASRMRSEWVLVCGYLARKASNSSSESLGGKKTGGEVGSNG